MVAEAKNEPLIKVFD